MPTNHRPSDAQCKTQAPPGDCNFGGGAPGMCNSDSSCTDGGPSGRCVESGGGIAYCGCTYDTCADDAACTKGSTCACHGSPYTLGQGNTCMPGNCRVDADCGGGGGYCSPAYNVNSCGGLAGYYCHTPTDLCVDDSDCGTSNGPQVCTYSTTTTRWECHVQELCG